MSRPAVDIHYSNVSGIMRFYKDGKCYAKRDDYAAVVSVIWPSDDSVYLYGAMGELPHNQYAGMLQMLYEKGAETAEMKRANGRRAPYFQQVSVGEQETLWRADLKSLFAEG